MRTSVLSLAAIVLITLADCTDKGNGAGSGGSSSSAGATHSAGSGSSSGATNSAASSSSSGATNSAASSSSSGATGVAGSTATTGGSGATGGASSTGGSGSSGGPAPSAGTSGGGATSPTYQGPCDLLSGGCAEAYSVTRAMTASYKGPLFQLGLAADKNAKTLDIGQTDAHTADMTTWSAYCGGSASKCVVSKIYAQIHSGSNDLLPAIWNAPWGPNCSAGGYTCAAKFTIESATNLPILTTVAPQEYALS